MELTRRDLLKGAAALGAAATVGLGLILARQIQVADRNPQAALATSPAVPA